MRNARIADERQAEEERRLAEKHARWAAEPVAGARPPPRLGRSAPAALAGGHGGTGRTDRRRARAALQKAVLRKKGRTALQKASGKRAGGKPAGAGEGGDVHLGRAMQRLQLGQQRALLLRRQVVDGLPDKREREGRGGCHRCRRVDRRRRLGLLDLALTHALQLRGGGPVWGESVQLARGLLAS